MDTKYIAKKLKARREELGLTQEEVAKKAGIAQPTYARYEKGEAKRLEFLDVILEALNLELENVAKKKYSIEHLPEYLQDFVSDHKNIDALKRCYAYALSESNNNQPG